MIRRLTLRPSSNDDNYPNVTFVEIAEVFKSLQTDSSPWEDGVHNRFLKNLSSKCLFLWLNIINLSLVIGLPNLGTIIPKKESNSNNSADNRPISLLSCLGNLEERITVVSLKAIIYSHTPYRDRDL